MIIPDSFRCFKSGINLVRGGGGWVQGVHTPPSSAQVGCKGCVQFFMIKQTNIREIMKHTLYTTVI